jgi:hypothetical protein
MNTDSHFLTFARTQRRTFNEVIFQCNYNFSHGCTVYGPVYPTTYLKYVLFVSYS